MDEVVFRGQPSFGSIRRGTVKLYQMDSRLRSRRLLIVLGRSAVVLLIGTAIVAWVTDPAASPGFGGFLRAHGVEVGLVLLWLAFELSPVTPLGLAIRGQRVVRTSPDRSIFTSDSCLISPPPPSSPDVHPWDYWDHWAAYSDGLILVSQNDRGLCPQFLPRRDMERPELWGGFTALVANRVQRYPKDRPRTQTRSGEWHDRSG